MPYLMARKVCLRRLPQAAAGMADDPEAGHPRLFNKSHCPTQPITRMSAQILDALDGIITVEVSGKLSPGELAANQREILAQLRDWGGGAILCLCESFEGWTGGDWGDLSFQLEADPLIRKMAIIGEREWEDLAMAFTAQGVRPFPITFFESGQLIEARAWLQA